MINKIIIVAIILLFTTNVNAQDQIVVSMEIIRNVWIAICCVLVFLMQPGFALLEGGLVRAKNIINVIMKNFSDVAIGSLFYWAIGYGFMFGENSTGFIGTSGFFGQSTNLSMLDVTYQLLFAATAATIVSGSLAERVSFIPYLIGAILITSLIYPVFGSWAWGGIGTDKPGWLYGLGFRDAAGSTVVHSVGGWCALAAALVLGPRLGRFAKKDGAVREIPGHNLPMFATGAFLLWVGWFGFNGGAAKSDLSDLGKILLNTHLSASAAVASAIITMKLRGNPVLMTKLINGALGGLVAITAACNVVEPQFAIVIGLVSGVIVVFGDSFLERFRIDDVVGAVPVHAFNGVWGTLAVGLFYSGDLFNVDIIISQVIGIIVAFIWSFSMSYIVFKLIDKILGLRASTFHEQRGLDYTEHSELGYSEFMNVQTYQGKVD